MKTKLMVGLLVFVTLIMMCGCSSVNEVTPDDRYLETPKDCKRIVDIDKTKSGYSVTYINNNNQMVLCVYEYFSGTLYIYRYYSMDTDIVLVD